MIAQIIFLILIYIVFILIPCGDVLLNTKNPLHKLQMVIVMFITSLLIFGIIRLKVDIIKLKKECAQYEQVTQ
jgi:hypothetical protein